MGLSRSNRRMLGSLLQSGGKIFSDYSTEKRKQNLGMNKAQRLQDLFSGTPELEGFELAIDPNSGEFDEVAMMVLKQRAKEKADQQDNMARRQLEEYKEIGRDRRSINSANAIADRMFAQASLNDKFARQRERDKRAYELEGDPSKFESLLMARGLPPLDELIDYDQDPDDILSRIRTGKKLPRGVSEDATPVHEQFFNLFKSDEDDIHKYKYKIISPEDEYDKRVPN